MLDGNLLTTKTWKRNPGIIADPSPPRRLIPAELQGEHKERTLSWGAYHLNPDEINSRPESLCAYAGIPPALVRLEPSEFSLVGDAIITKGNPSPPATTGAATATAAAATTDDEEAAVALSSAEGDPVLSLPSPCPANNAG